MLGLLPRLATVSLPVADCRGLVLAEQIVSEVDLPPFPVATRDGYALSAGDVSGACAKPAILPVVAELAAGSLPPDHFPARAAAQIMTGAPLPRCADSVVPSEHCSTLLAAAVGDSDAVKSGAVKITTFISPGQFVAPAGTEFKRGATVLEPGAVLRAPELTVLSALGRNFVRVIPRPKVAVVVTGSELVGLDTAAAAGRVYASNALLVPELVTANGALVMRVQVVQDEEEKLRAAMMAAMDADLILTTGGTAQGVRDLVAHVLTEAEEASLWAMPVRGSKPAAFRLLQRPEDDRCVPHLALPGRPIAAAVAFELFARPLIRQLRGLPPGPPQFVRARLARGIRGTPGRHRYIAVRLRRSGRSWLAHPYGEEAPYGLAGIVCADGFAVLGRRVGDMSAGRRVHVLIWSQSYVEFATPRL